VASSNFTCRDENRLICWFLLICRPICSIWFSLFSCL